jgi:hypothetical protein
MKMRGGNSLTSQPTCRRERHQARIIVVAPIRGLVLVADILVGLVVMAMG